MDAKTKKNQKNEENAGENSSSTKDTEKHSYYYDDAHGYEVYRAEDDEDDEKQID